MTNQPSPTRVRIYSHITQSRFLHVEDALMIGKVRLFSGNYRKGAGMKAYANAFVDIADVRVIFGALACGEQGFAHKEYKGTPPRNGSGAVSRVLSVAIKGNNVYIELKTGPGKLTTTGAITPNGPAKVEVTVGFKLYEACRMAASVLAYIHAWDVLRMMSHHGMVSDQQMISKWLPYLLVSATSEANISKTSPTNGVSKPNGTTRAPVVAANNSLPPRPTVSSRRRGGCPTTRKTDQPATAAKPLPAANGRSQNRYSKQNGNSLLPQTLFYGDGTLVSADNQTECSTYARYQQAKGSLPPSKSALLQYYQQQVAA